jgi:hypothetical protein
MYIPLDLLLIILEFTSNFKIKYIILKYIKPGAYKSLVSNAKTIQRFYTMYKFTTIKDSEMWGNKSYIIRLIFKYYSKGDIITLPEKLIIKLKKNNYYNNIIPCIENINIKQIDNRKPSDVLKFLNSIYITRSILCYNGF